LAVFVALRPMATVMVERSRPLEALVVRGGIFINYRGEDSHSYGALLHTELSRRFGSELVFLDSESIPPGADFEAQLLGRVRAARVVLAVIGTRWLAAADADGQRRLDDPADWIRRELVEALRTGVRVIPVLTDDARMPTEADLPADLAALRRCQFRRLRRRDASVDLARLAAELADLDVDLAAAAATRPAVAGWPVPNQLPTADRYFTGRQAELTRLLGPAQGPARDGPRALRICAVDGMAGIGKTALVVLAGHQLADAGRFPDGTLFVDLHGYSSIPSTDPVAALDTLLRGLGMPGPQIPPGLDARIGLYRSVTARRRILIVLDNALEETQVRPLLPGGVDSLVLVTSRRRLSGLDEADHLNLETLPPDDAAWLFRAVAGPDRDPGDQHTVEAVVDLCGYLPLALRIAAARLRADRSPVPMTGSQILTELRTEKHHDRLAALAEGDRSVAAAFALSYKHLPPDQQQAFTALGAHPGADFEPYAAAALLNTTPVHAARLLHALEQVNLLERPTPGRHRFHDLIRAYATTAAVNDLDIRRAALDRLYAHYAYTTTNAMKLAYPHDADHEPRSLRQPSTPCPHLTDQTAAMAWLDTEQPNLLATVADASIWRPEYTIHQSASLHRHLHTRGHYTAALVLHQHALGAAQAADSTEARTTALNNLGRIHYVQDRYGAAADCHTEALGIARATGHPAGELTALNGLGHVHAAEGQYGPAADCHTQALEIARATGHAAGELDALNGHGYVHTMQGRYGPAADCHAQALEIAHATSRRADELAGLTGLGYVHTMQGRHGPAADCHTQALEIARAIGHQPAELNALNGLGLARYAQGQYQAAANCHTQALEIARAIGNRGGELGALNGLGRINHVQGRYGPAAECFGQVLDLAREIGDTNYQFEGHLGLGRTHHASGHPGDALAAHQQALTLARDLDQPTDQARAHDGLAHAHHTLDHPGQARRHWQLALAILTTLDMPAAEDITAADIRTNLAHLGDAPPRPPGTCTGSRGQNRLTELADEL
jgi:tetratricopeptide (TPR) repeat protein